MDNAIVAKVGTITVTNSEVEEMLAELKNRGQDLNNPKGRALVVDQLVNNKLLLLDAQKNLYEYDPLFKAQLKKVKEDMLTNFALAKALESVKAPTEDEIKQYYEENKAKFVAEESVNASHILVDAADKAQSIMDEIKAGSITFEDAAKKYSSCPSKENGGNLGEFVRGQMVPEFDAAVFTMSPGELKGPVKTQFGYHIIRLNAKNAPKPITFDEIKPQIAQLLYKDKQQKAYESKINQLKILYPVDLL